MFIKVKPLQVYSSDGFDFFGRPESKRTVLKRIGELRLNCNYQEGILVFHTEKHRYKRVPVETYTKSGKPSKKVTYKTIPTHWKYVIYFIPNEILLLLKYQKQKVVQHKHYFEIVDILNNG